VLIALCMFDFLRNVSDKSAIMLFLIRIPCLDIVNAISVDKIRVFNE